MQANRFISDVKMLDNKYDVQYSAESDGDVYRERD